MLTAPVHTALLAVLLLRGRHLELVGGHLVGQHVVVERGRLCMVMKKGEYP